MVRGGSKQAAPSEPIFVDVIDSDDDDTNLARSKLKNTQRSVVGWKLDNCELSRDSVNLLNPGLCLDDQLIDFFLIFIRKFILTPEQQKRWVIFNTHFFTRLVSSDNRCVNPAEQYERVRRWTRSLPCSVLDADVVIIPVNTHNLHWWVAVIVNPGAAASPPFEIPKELLSTDETAANDSSSPPSKCPDASLNTLPGINAKQPYMIFIDPLGSTLRPYQGDPTNALPRFFESEFKDKYPELVAKGWTFNLQREASFQFKHVGPSKSDVMEFIKESIKKEKETNKDHTSESLNAAVGLRLSQFQHCVVKDFATTWRVVRNPSTPRQRNSFDCGIFVISTVLALVVHKESILAEITTEQEANSRKPQRPSRYWWDHLDVAFLRKQLRTILGDMKGQGDWTQNPDLVSRYLEAFVTKPIGSQKQNIHNEMVRFLRAENEKDDLILWTKGAPMLSDDTYGDDGEDKLGISPGGLLHQKLHSAGSQGSKPLLTSNNSLQNAVARAVAKTSDVMTKVNGGSSSFPPKEVPGESNGANSNSFGGNSYLNSYYGNNSSSDLLTTPIPTAPPIHNNGNMPYFNPNIAAMYRGSASGQFGIKRFSQSGKVNPVPAPSYAGVNLANQFMTNSGYMFAQNAPHHVHPSAMYLATASVLGKPVVNNTMNSVGLIPSHMALITQNHSKIQMNNAVATGMNNSGGGSTNNAVIPSTTGINNNHNNVISGAAETSGEKQKENSVTNSGNGKSGNAGVDVKDFDEVSNMVVQSLNALFEEDPSVKSDNKGKSNKNTDVAAVVNKKDGKSTDDIANRSTTEVLDGVVEGVKRVEREKDSQEEKTTSEDRKTSSANVCGVSEKDEKREDVCEASEIGTPKAPNKKIRLQNK